MKKNNIETYQSDDEGVTLIYDPLSDKTTIDVKSYGGLSQSIQAINSLLGEIGGQSQNQPVQPDMQNMMQMFATIMQNQLPSSNQPQQPAQSTSEPVMGQDGVLRNPPRVPPTNRFGKENTNV